LGFPLNKLEFPGEELY
jgi:hypothetical protein